MRNYHKMSRLLVISLLAVGLAGCGNTVSNVTENLESSVIGEGSGSGKLVSKGKESFENNEFDSIQVKTQAMGIYLTRSTSDLAEVELLTDQDISNKITFEASVRSGTLEIEVEEKSKALDFSNQDQTGERKLLIALPDRLYEEIKIANEFGHVEAADLKAGTVDVKLNAGAIKLNGVSGKINLETNAGEIVVEGISLENDLSAKADVGEIKIQLNESPKAAIVNLQSEVGEVTADLEGLQYDVDQMNHKTGTIGSNGFHIEAFTNVGAIQVGTN